MQPIQAVAQHRVAQPSARLGELSRNVAVRPLGLSDGLDHRLRQQVAAFLQDRLALDDQAPLFAPLEEVHLRRCFTRHGAAS